MQAISLDFSQRNVTQSICAKQGDIGRKIIVLLKVGESLYMIPEGTTFSVWYSGTSGMGNYTQIDGHSAFEVTTSSVTVELINKMLMNKGGGTLCLMMHGSDGSQLGLWNIPYIVEPVPGMDSQEAQQCFTTLKDAMDIASDSARKAVTAAEKLEIFHSYDSLHTAIGDINNGTRSNALPEGNVGSVKVYPAENDAIKVVLLTDVDEPELIAVNKNLELVLNGKKLRFTDSAAHLNLGADAVCIIDGTANGSAIYKNVAAAGTMNLIRADAGKLVIRGGTYTLSGATATALPFRIYSDEFEMYDADVICSTPTSATNCRAFQTNTKAKIERCTVNVTGSKNPVAYYVSGGDTTFKNCVINVSSENASADAYGIRLISSAGVATVTCTDIMVTSSLSATGIKQATNANVYVTDCDISATTTAAINSTGHAYGVGTDVGVLYISGSTVFADARGAHANLSCSSGISNSGTLFCKDTDVTGTLSGITNHIGAKLYVSGGVFAAYSHGGLYLAHGADGIAYIRDATLRGGTYTGQFTDNYPSSANSIYGLLYIGGANDVSAYFDGCTMLDKAGSFYGIVMRGSDGETGHILNISNSKVEKYIRMDNDTMTLNAGWDSGIEEEFVYNSGVQEGFRGVPNFTNALYRRHHESERLNGRDFAAMAAYYDTRK